MLYKYEFVKIKKTLELNSHFLYFIRKSRNVKATDKFLPKKYFHKSFLDKTHTKIAPSGVFNRNLHEKFQFFFNDFKVISDLEKLEFYNLIVYSNNIHNYFENDLITDIVKLRNSNIKRLIKTDSFKDLMTSLWENLKSPNSWDIDDHYQEFHKKLPESKMCPFCGLDNISAYNLFKSDYDHIALKGVYPISSINLKNIAPTCSKCNQKFKLITDVFFDKHGNRRKFWYPYIFNKKFEIQKIEISLHGSIIPNTDLLKIDGNWIVEILPINGFTSTWNNVYKIKERYTNAISHSKWTDELIKIIKLHNVQLNNYQTVKEYIKKYAEIYNPDDLHIEYHLKYAYFKHLSESNNVIFFEQIKQRSA